MHAAAVLLGPHQPDREVGVLLELPGQVVVVGDPDVAGAGGHRLEQLDVVGVDLGVGGPAAQRSRASPPRRRRRSCWPPATAGSRCWSCAGRAGPPTPARPAPRTSWARRPRRSCRCCRRSCGRARPARTSGCRGRGTRRDRLVERRSSRAAGTGPPRRRPEVAGVDGEVDVGLGVLALGGDRSRSSASLPVRNSTSIAGLLGRTARTRSRCRSADPSTRSASRRRRRRTRERRRQRRPACTAPDGSGRSCGSSSEHPTPTWTIRHQAGTRPGIG